MLGGEIDVAWVGGEGKGFFFEVKKYFVHWN